MSFLQPIVNDLRERRLWPVALVLLLALVAVPLLLSKSPDSSSAAPRPAPMSAAANPVTALPAVSLSAAATHSRLGGQARDPFAQQAVSGPTASSITSPQPVPSGAAVLTGKSTTPTSGGTTTSGGSSAGGDGTSQAAGGDQTHSSSPTPTKFPTAPPKPAPPVLRATQAYQVTLAITNPSGGLNTIDPLKRLSILPGKQQPLLVELGVLQGGHRVLFAVQPETSVSGPGTCIPGRVDCEIISLVPNQIERIWGPSLCGPTVAAEFAITAIAAHRYPSAGAAARARRAASAAGRRLLDDSGLDALALLRYDPSLGAMVDQRNR